MEFQKYVTEYFDSRTDGNPSAMYDDDVQLLLDMSRQVDLETRSIERPITPEIDEDTEGVTQKEPIPSSLAETPEPATDSASLNERESSPDLKPLDFNELDGTTQEISQSTTMVFDSDPESAADAVFNILSPPETTPEADASDTEKSSGIEAEVNTIQETDDPDPLRPSLSEPVDDEITDVKFTGIDDSRGDEAVVTDAHQEAVSEYLSDLASRDQQEPSDDQPPLPGFSDLHQSHDEGLSVSMPEQSLSHVPSEFPLDFNEAIRHVEKEIPYDPTSIEIVEAGFEVPDLPEIPQSVFVDSSRSVGAMARQMIERDRL